MNENEKAAYVHAMAASAMIEALGMQADNAISVSAGRCPEYGKAAFDDLITKYGIHHNQVIETFRQ